MGNGKKNNVSVVRINCDVLNGVKKECGLAYIKTKMENGAIEIPADELEIIVDSYCIMLSYKKVKREFRGEYTIIFDDWEVMRENGSKGIPDYDEKLFQRNQHVKVFEDIDFMLYSMSIKVLNKENNEKGYHEI